MVTRSPLMASIVPPAVTRRIWPLTETLISSSVAASGDSGPKKATPGAADGTGFGSCPHAGAASNHADKTADSAMNSFFKPILPGSPDAPVFKGVANNVPNHHTEPNRLLGHLTID